MSFQVGGNNNKILNQLYKEHSQSEWIVPLEDPDRNKQNIFLEQNSQQKLQANLSKVQPYQIEQPQEVSKFQFTGREIEVKSSGGSKFCRIQIKQRPNIELSKLQSTEGRVKSSGGGVLSWLCQKISSCCKYLSTCCEKLFRSKSSVVPMNDVPLIPLMNFSQQALKTTDNSA